MLRAVGCQQLTKQTSTQDKQDNHIIQYNYIIQEKKDLCLLWKRRRAGDGDDDDDDGEDGGESDCNGDGDDGDDGDKESWSQRQFIRRSKEGKVSPTVKSHYISMSHSFPLIILRVSSPPNIRLSRFH